MRRRAKPAKPKVEAKLRVARKSRENEGSRVRDLEELLAAALKREAEGLEQQTAASEILRAIASSPTDVQPVFDAIVRSASRLCGGEYAIVTRYDGELLHLAAQHNPWPGTADAMLGFFPQVPRRETSITARALVVGRECDPPVRGGAGVRPPLRRSAPARCRHPQRRP